MQKLPTTGPSKSIPSTKAVAPDSLTITGSPLEFVIPLLMSFTYLSKNYRNS